MHFFKNKEQILPYVLWLIKKLTLWEGYYSTSLTALFFTSSWCIWLLLSRGCWGPERRGWDAGRCLLSLRTWGSQNANW